jgi:4-hydroxyproline epimerase
MCGHGMIGVVATLRWLGRLKAGLHRFETPAGVVRVQLDAAGNVQLENVTSCRWRRDVVLDLPSGKTIRGDIAWGGNWFFLAAEHGQPIDWAEIPRLTAVTTSIRAALESRGICGRSGGVIDHIELVTPLPDAAADFANFVLCPGMAFDRSPCGTGSSAKVACLAAADQLAPGQRIRIRGITGECFEASYRWAGPEDEGAEEWSEAEGRPIIPTIIGRAYVNGRCELVFDPQDPFRFGLSVG